MDLGRSFMLAVYGVVDNGAVVEDHGDGVSGQGNGRALSGERRVSLIRRSFRYTGFIL